VHESPPATADAFGDIPESEYPIEIGLAKTKELYDRGGLVILDARETEEYAEGHLRGAQSAPGDVVAGDLAWLERMSQEPRPILVYCGGGDCELSINLGFELTRSGHRRVLVFKDGFPPWKDAGYPVDEGAAP
jgi:rhodanese-related sulfurtransferase